jgi:hypothetical protein
MEESRSERGYPVQYYTPRDPEVGNQIVIFSGDTAYFYKDNSPNSAYRFKIQREFEVANYLNDSIPVLCFYSLSSGHLSNYVYVEICSSQLLMSGPYATHLWVRQ